MSMKDQLKEEAKRERQKLSSMSLKDKIWYIWEYYKFHIIGVIVVAFAVISIGTTVHKNNYETAFYAMIINASSAEDSNTDYIEQGFKEYLGFDDNTQVTVDSSLHVSFDDTTEMGYAGLAKITAMVASKELDAMITDEENIEHYASVGGLTDLEAFLPADVLELVKDKLYYAKDGEGNTIACAVDISDTPFEAETGLSINPPLVGFLGNTPHTDTCAAFLKYLFE